MHHKKISTADVAAADVVKAVMQVKPTISTSILKTRFKGSGDMAISCSHAHDASTCITYYACEIIMYIQVKYHVHT